jgi:hypothetical protein
MKNKITIETCQELAKFHNGKCLNTIYKNNHDPMLWECEKGHQWICEFQNIHYTGRWCAKCSGKIRKLSITDLHELAIKFGGRLISTEYKDASTKVEWECKNKHKFFKSASKIKESNGWCPQCSAWSSESICRLYFETIFKTKFLKVRPNWLLSPSKTKLELDGLSEIPLFKNKYLAFEHQGLQHYTEVEAARFGIDFAKRQEYDQIKIDLCEKNNVILIQVPQLMKLTKLNNLSNFIKNKCLELNLDINDFNFDIELNYSTIFTPDSDIKINKIKSIIESKGGSLVTKNYLNSLTGIEFICDKGHKSERTYINFKRDKWCITCSQNDKYKSMTIIKLIKYYESINNIIKTKNATLLTDVSEYQDVYTKLNIKCNLCNLEFSTCRKYIIKGKWHKCKGSVK